MSFLNKNKRKGRGIPGPLNIPPLPQQQRETVYHIPFTIPEIDRLMTDLIDLNIPIQTYMMLDKKFNEIKRKSLGVPLVGGGESGKEVIVHQSKMNVMEGREIIPDFVGGKEYFEGEKYVRRDPFGVFMIGKGGEEIEITTNEGSDQSVKHGPGETN